MTSTDEPQIPVEQTKGFGLRLPLYTQVVIAVICGTAFGVAFGQDPYLGGLRNEHLGRLGMLVILLLKTLAIPLIFFAILDAFIRTSLPLRQGTRLIVICLINVSVAMAIGLMIMNTWQPGLAWYGHMDQLGIVSDSKPSAGDPANGSQSGAPNSLEQIASYIPRTMLQPFSSNNVIGVVVLALMMGALLRRLRAQSEHAGAIETVVQAVEKIYHWLVRILWWIIYLVPFAVFGVLAYVVGRVGLGAFSALGIFLAAIMAGLTLHAFVYYPVVAWLVGKKSPKTYLGQGADAIMTAVSCNSSLATVPITLRCLERMKVSPESARLAACVGTNLNNDGITLYEAMAALFLAQALGYRFIDGTSAPDRDRLYHGRRWCGGHSGSRPGRVAARALGCRSAEPGDRRRHSAHHDCGLDPRQGSLGCERHERHAGSHPARCRGEEADRQ